MIDHTSRLLGGMQHAAEHFFDSIHFDFTGGGQSDRGRIWAVIEFDQTHWLRVIPGHAGGVTVMEGDAALGDDGGFAEEPGIVL